MDAKKRKIHIDDAGDDTGVDAGIDVGVDSSVGTSANAGVDAGVDSGAGVDAGADADEDTDDVAYDHDEKKVGAELDLDLDLDPGIESRDGSDDSDEGAGDPYAEIERLRDQYLRLNADFDNYRKRTQRDKQEWIRYSSQGIVEKLLGVIDNFDAAAGSVGGSRQDAKSVAEGFLMIHKQLSDILSREGLSEIPALGETFDPNVHEAVMTVSPGEGQKDNEIVMVMRKGYMYKDKVLRPSMVQVAKDS